MTSFDMELQFKALGRLLALAGGIAVVLMMVHIVVDVFMKYVFNDPVDGTTEIVAAYYMVSAVFLPLAYVTFIEGHLIVELFTSHMSGRKLTLLTCFTGVLTLAYLLFLIYATGEEAVLRTKSGEAWETSVDLVAVWPSRWLLPVGLGVMALIVLAQTITQLRDGLRSIRTPPPDV